MLSLSLTRFPHGVEMLPVEEPMILDRAVVILYQLVMSMLIL